MLGNSLKSEIRLETLLTVGNVSDAICYCHNLWDMVLVIFLGGNSYSCIQAGLSRHEESGIITGREILLT